jgi:hypothetical protein
MNTVEPCHLLCASFVASAQVWDLLLRAKNLFVTGDVPRASRPNAVATTNKCLAQSSKSRTGMPATLPASPSRSLYIYRYIA